MSATKLCEIPFDAANDLPKYVVLGSTAGGEAMRAAEVDPDDIDLLIVGTCTGPRNVGDWRLAGLEPPAVTIEGDLSFTDATDQLAAQLGIGAPGITLSTACSSGIAVVAHAWHLLQSGRIRTALCLGVEEWWYAHQLGYELVSGISEEGCSPYGRSDGTTMGEAAAAVVLQVAPSRSPLGYVTGVGQSADAYHPSRPDLTAGGALLALDRALGAAGRPGRLDLIAGHGAGTKAGDVMERRLAKRLPALLGHDGAAPPMFSAKNLHGHTVGASGTLELVELVLGLRGEADLTAAAYLGDPYAGDADPSWVGMKNAFALGGLNCSIVVAAEPPAPTVHTGECGWLAAGEATGGRDVVEGVALCGAERLEQLDALSSEACGVIGGLLAVSGLVELVDPTEIGLFLATESGPARGWHETRQAWEAGEEVPNSTLTNLTRHACVSNACEVFGLRGPSTAFYAASLDASPVLDAARAAIEVGAAPAVLVVEIENRHDELVARGCIVVDRQRIGIANPLTREATVAELAQLSLRA